MSKPTKRARKKDSTMLNNQARIKEIAAIKNRLKKLEQWFAAITEDIYDRWGVSSISNVMSERGKKK